MTSYSREKAIQFLRDSILDNGLVLDELRTTEEEQQGKIPKIFLWNQCCLTAEVFRRLGDKATVDRISKAVHSYLDAKHNPTHNSMSALVHQSIFPSKFSDHVNNDLIFPNYAGKYLVTSNFAKSLKVQDVAKLSTNRAFLRCINSWNKGNKDDAKKCYEKGMGFFDGFGLGYDAEKARYSSYIIFLQHYAHTITGFTYPYKDRIMHEVLPNHADKMQIDSGKVRQFCQKDYSWIGVNGNTETTAICVLSDIVRNGIQ